MVKRITLAHTQYDNVLCAGVALWHHKRTKCVTALADVVVWSTGWRDEHSAWTRGWQPPCGAVTAGRDFV